MYRMSTSGGLTIALQRGDTYGNLADVGSLMYRAPYDAYNAIYRAAFDWEITLPTNWSFGVEYYSQALAYIGGSTIATGNGATQSGAYSATFAGSYVFAIVVYNNTGASHTATGETGTKYARCTNVRLLGSSSSTVSANGVAWHMMNFVNSVNPGQLSSASVNLQDPGLDLRDEVYEDEHPADILNYLAGLGDTSTPPRVWEWGVNNDQALYFRPRGYGRSWYVDASTIDIERTIGVLSNSAYATYQEAGGRTLRTSTSSDSISVARNGLTRREAVETSTTAIGQATTHRDAALNDGKDPRPRTAIEVRMLRSDSGSRAYPWEADSGDTVTIRNLPPTISASVDRIRSFVISEVEYDADTGIAKLTPEDPVPSLDVITARYAAGLGFVVGPFTAGKRTNRR